MLLLMVIMEVVVMFIQVDFHLFIQVNLVHAKLCLRSLRSELVPIMIFAPFMST